MDLMGRMGSVEERGKSVTNTQILSWFLALKKNYFTWFTCRYKGDPGRPGPTRVSRI